MNAASKFEPFVYGPVAAWDPSEFIDWCETCYGTDGPDHDLWRQVSLAEWWPLFDYSYRQVTGVKRPA